MTTNPPVIGLQMGTISTCACGDATERSTVSAVRIGNPFPDSAGQDALQLQLQLQMAFKAAAEAQKVAAEAESKADKARAYDDSVRHSYKNCLSGEESQDDSRGKGGTDRKAIPAASVVDPVKLQEPALKA